MNTRLAAASRVHLAAVVLVAVSCSRGSKEESVGSPRPGAPVKGALAQVNESRLTTSEMQRLIPPEFRDGISGPEIRDILERWVRTELLVQKARKEGLDRDPGVAARLRDLERETLADEYLQREMAKRVRVGNDEIQAFYDAHRREYTQELHLEHILLNTREEAESILGAIQGGANFEATAKQHSLDPTAANGGDLGFLGKGGINPAFESAVYDMKPGSVSGPIASSFGFHVVKLLEARPAKEPVPLDAARDEILHELLLQKQQKVQDEFLAQLRAEAHVRVATSYAGMSLVETQAEVAPKP